RACGRRSEPQTHRPRDRAPARARAPRRPRRASRTREGDHRLPAGGGVKSTRRRLLALAGGRRRSGALSIRLRAATGPGGVGLMTPAGYLISRAAERPAVLSLTVAIVLVRLFGLARPLARYFERLASHDLALRVLGRSRVRVYESIEPLAPAQLDGYRRGDLLSRLVADVDSLQNLHLRGVGPPLVALVAGAVSVAVTAAFLPPPPPL